jgi:hypothetical protein
VHWSKRRSAKGRCFAISSPAIPIKYTHNPHNNCSRQTSLEEYFTPLHHAVPQLHAHWQTCPSLTLDPLSKGRHAVRREIGALQFPEDQWLFSWRNGTTERLKRSGLQPHYIRPAGKVASCFFDPLYLTLTMQVYTLRPSSIVCLSLPPPSWLTPACTCVSTLPSHGERSSRSRPR